MAVVNISRTKLIAEVQKQFPRSLKPENLADVVIAGDELNAYDSSTSKNKRAFILKGAKPNSVYTAYEKYGLLDVRKAPRIPLLFYKRGPAPAKSELSNVLNFERKGLYIHLTVSNAARNVVAKILNLNLVSVRAIKQTIEHGTLREQVDFYDKVVTELDVKKLYNKNYNYVWLGFRFLPYRYWLSNLARKLLARAKV